MHLVAHFEKLGGTACYAPYIEGYFTTLMKKTPGDATRFKFRIDTGADVTCVPSKYVDGSPLFGKPILVRGHDGHIVRARRHLGIVSIETPDGVVSVRPEAGVLLTGSEIGLLGMDILKNLHLEMRDQKLTLSSEDL